MIFFCILPKKLKFFVLYLVVLLQLVAFLDNQGHDTNHKINKNYLTKLADKIPTPEKIHHWDIYPDPLCHCSLFSMKLFLLCSLEASQDYFGRSPMNSLHRFQIPLLTKLLTEETWDQILKINELNANSETFGADILRRIDQLIAINICRQGKLVNLLFPSHNVSRFFKSPIVLGTLLIRFSSKKYGKFSSLFEERSKY
ncbi:hypothetical protein BpHYR1_009476 [Brachionus plicatilis]|uniref:Uncharacterized protein n=1 Tax=Brachionus plicatilis TaxID=10195 RepID=A0A3M7RZV2_BRAPC|nr:hypothetical protein BpHYR1_009476 [Brachionus plicatilis]